MLPLTIVPQVSSHASRATGRRRTAGAARRSVRLVPGLVCVAVLAAPALAAPVPAAPAPAAPAPASPGPLARPTTAPAADAARVQRMILDLDSSSAKVRRAASLQLNSLGPEALPAVEAALKNANAGPEAVARLKAAAAVLRPRAVRQQRSKAWADWEARALHDAYQKGGKTGPPWDAAVHRAIDLHLQLGPEPAKGPAEPRQRATDAFKAATDAGCTDALVRCLYRLSVGEDFAGRRNGPWKTKMEKDLDDVAKGAYPPYAKYYAHVRYIRELRQASNEAARPIPGLLGEIAAASAGMPEGEVDHLADVYFEALQAPGSLDQMDRFFLPFMAAYRAAAPKQVGPLVFDARFQIEAGWARRGPPPDDPRFPERLDVFHVRMTHAAESLEAAWKLDPNDARTARLMVAVVVARGDRGGGREVLETWFRRAIAADPDDLESCRARLKYLSSPGPAANAAANADARAAMIDFGRECLKTENWRAGIPYVLSDAHLAIAEASADSKEYLERADVWADVQEVYEGAVLNFPDDTFRRSQYARLAARCGQWETAHRQFEALGDRAVLDVFGGTLTYDYYRKKAARLASGGAPATKPAPRASAA